MLLQVRDNVRDFESAALQSGMFGGKGRPSREERVRSGQGMGRTDS